MADMFEYLSWRGDLAFGDVPPTAVDALILSTLVYCDFAGIVPEDGAAPVSLQAAAEAFLALPEQTRLAACRYLEALDLYPGSVSAGGLHSTGRSEPGQYLLRCDPDSGHDLAEECLFHRRKSRFCL